MQTKLVSHPEEVLRASFHPSLVDLNCANPLFQDDGVIGIGTTSNLNDVFDDSSQGELQIGKRQRILPTEDHTVITLPIKDEAGARIQPGLQDRATPPASPFPSDDENDDTETLPINGGPRPRPSYSSPESLTAQ